MTAISGTLGAFLALAVVLWRERRRRKPAVDRSISAAIPQWTQARRRMNDRVEPDADQRSVSAEEEHRRASVGPGGARVG